MLRAVWPLWKKVAKTLGASLFFEFSHKLVFRDASSGLASFDQNGQTAEATAALTKSHVLGMPQAICSFLMTFEPDAKLMINFLGMPRGFWPLLTQNGQNVRGISKFQSKTYGPQLPPKRPRGDVWGGAVGHRFLIEISKCLGHFAHVGSKVAKTLGASPKSEA